MAGATKVIIGKNQFFHARQPREEIFEIRSYTGLIFTTVYLNFDQLFQDFKNFWLKSLQMCRTFTAQWLNLLEEGTNNYFAVIFCLNILLL